MPVPISGVTFTRVEPGAPGAPVTWTAVTSKIDGSTSVMTTPDAGAVPLFVTFNVKVTVSPTEACSGFTDFDKAGSATCTTAVGVGI